MNLQSEAQTAPARLERHAFSFEGQAGEYFRIWIVNLVLSILTLGIFSAWAKVRSRRYFYGNTHVAGHGFEYHASPLRILLGRVIALTLLVGYSLSGMISPYAALAWLVLLLIALPWLIVSSLRFNARNSSYRNVHFYFTGGYWQAFRVMILWPLLAYVTLLTTLPLAHRAGIYFYVNKHTYGGSHFEARIPGGKMYLIYLLLYVPLIAFGIAGAILARPLMAAMASGDASAITVAMNALFPFILVAYIVLIVGAIAQQVLIFNLTINNTKLAGQHELRSTMSAWAVIWITVSNFIATIFTLGLLYPWAHVRMARYQFEHLELLAASDMGTFSSLAEAGGSAVGEEVAGFFDLDFGL